MASTNLNTHCDFSCPDWLQAIKCNHEWVKEETVHNGCIMFVFATDTYIDEFPNYFKVIQKSMFCIKCQLGNTVLINLGESTSFPTSG